MVSAAALTALGFPDMYVGGRGRSDATKKIKYVAMTISTADFSLLPQFLLQKGMWPPIASSILVETVRSVCRELEAGNTEEKKKRKVIILKCFHKRSSYILFVQTKWLFLYTHEEVHIYELVWGIAA